MITFKQFLHESATGLHGEYINDVAEKTMIHAIINILMKGEKTEENYATAYSFIESDMTKKFYDRFYDAFAEKAEQGMVHRDDRSKIQLSPTTEKLMGEFKNELKHLFNRWKSTT